MSLISSEHDQGGFPKDAPPTPANPGKSRYCYLFPNDAAEHSAGLFSDPPTGEEDTIHRLLSLATWLEQQNGPLDLRDTQLRIPLPAAYTYFAQFVNHDLSAPVGGMLKDVNAIPNASSIDDRPLYAGKTWRGTDQEVLLHFQNEHQTPLNLDSLYGEGPHPTAGRRPPDAVRRLYDAEGLCFVLGQTCDASAGFAGLTTQPDKVARRRGAPDLPRETDPRKPAQALLADRRNDQNLILSQMHLALMLLHNKAVAALRPSRPDPAACFAAARSLVTRHYHWCILHDLLPRLLSQQVLDRLDPNAPSRLTERLVPLEFTTAAFRFGHSMVADAYDFNENFGAEALISPWARLSELFAFTTKGGMGSLGAHSALPDHWVIDWDRMTDPNRSGLTRSDAIDLNFAQMMMKVVPHNDDRLGSIIARNLARGFHRRIPFGQVMARAYDVPVLSAEEIASAMPRGLDSDPQHKESPDKVTQRKAILRETPAWLYFLCEAKLREGGTRLGPTASHIIADTFIGLMQLDDTSILGAKGKGWTPSASPLKQAGQAPLATLRDLLLFAVA